MRLAGDAVDGEALRATVTLATAGDLAAALATLKGVLRPAPLATLRTAAADLGIVAKAQGYRVTADVLKLSTSTADMGRFTRMSARFGNGFRGLLAALGALALTLAGLTVTLTS
ncbi:hypothetical protein NKH70_32680 [Mesorhizobium sp. M0991]|uniref:hypothetical protein n=1 Tax=Mesorhizobium sp. M0991 TaxID=2957043 RepID=UPI00333BC733